MVLESQEYDMVWDRIYDELHFEPSVDSRVVPFSISTDYVIYDISTMNETCVENTDDLIAQAFINCTKEGELLYALDWQHSGFQYNPRYDEEQKSIWVKNDLYMGGGYHAYFPSYYPDGDYYFFIDCDFRFGYLSHPWQRKVWIFGNCLIQEFENIESKLGWHKIKF